jgi:hypothetical protein
MILVPKNVNFELDLMREELQRVAVSVWVAMCFGGDDGFISNAGDGFWLCWGHGDC